MYSQFRSEILASNRNSGLEHISALHPLKGPNLEDLYTDYFYTPEKKPICLLHLSGVHGIEGYLGSLVQRRILQESLSNLPFQIVIVHAVNPYGMAWRLRTNANNVDLNRNSLTQYEVENPLHQHFIPFLKTGTLVGFLKVVPSLIWYGINPSVQSIACGQTEFSDSLFYCGKQLQPELVSLEANIRKLVSPDARMLVLDVHTGLGKFAAESLITEDFSQEEEKKFSKAFQTKLVSLGRDPGAYISQGTLWYLFKRHWQTNHIIQEFGTRPPIKVLKSLIHKDPEQMLDAFFPDNEHWRQRCTELGLLRFKQLVQNFS